ncbi:zinc-ribbon domain-containing protein [Denitrobacterium detoxificans]
MWAGAQRRGSVMCFRPSPVKRENTDQKTCQTCGMPVDSDATTCPYCGDPIPQNPPDDYSDIDPSHNTRII